MKRTVAVTVALLALMISVVSAQQTYSNDKVEYTFEIPVSYTHLTLPTICSV